MDAAEPELMLTPEIVACEDDLAEVVDCWVAADPVARKRAAEIAEQIVWLRAGLDPDTWTLVLEIGGRVTERWSDLAVVLVREAFSAGRRHPLMKEESP